MKKEIFFIVAMFALLRSDQIIENQTYDNLLMEGTIQYFRASETVQKVIFYRALEPGERFYVTGPMSICGEGSKVRVGSLTFGVRNKQTIAPVTVVLDDSDEVYGIFGDSESLWIS